MTAKRIVWGSNFDIDYGYIRISVNAYQRLAKELYNIFDKEKCLKKSKSRIAYIFKPIDKID